MTTPEMQEFVDQLDMDQCVVMNKILKQRYRYLQEMKTLDFKVGQKVSFTGKGKIRSGEIVRINKNTVSVLEVRDCGNIQWNVSPSLIIKG